MSSVQGFAPEWAYLRGCISTAWVCVYSEPVHTLFLDTASHTGSLACLGPDATVVFREIPGRLSDDALLPTIDALLAEAGWTYAALHRILVATGPGGFTSVRVGVAAMNALAYGLNIPIAGVHVSALYAARLSPEPSDVWWLHSTRKTHVFARPITAPIDDTQLIGISDLGQTLASARAWTGELIADHVPYVQVVPMAPLQSLAAVLPYLATRATFAAPPVLPWYGRGI